MLPSGLSLGTSRTVSALVKYDFPLHLSTFFSFPSSRQEKLLLLLLFQHPAGGTESGGFVLSASSLQNPPCLGHPPGAAPRLGRRCWEGAGEGDVSSPSSLCVLSPSSASSWDLQKFSSLHSLLGHLGFGQLMALTRSLQQGQSCRSRRPRNSCKDRKGSPGPPQRGETGGKGPLCLTYPSPGSEQGSSFDFYEGCRDQANKACGFSQRQRAEHVPLPSLPPFPPADSSPWHAAVRSSTASRRE